MKNYIFNLPFFFLILFLSHPGFSQQILSETRPSGSLTPRIIAVIQDQLLPQSLTFNQSLLNYKASLNNAVISETAYFPRINSSLTPLSLSKTTLLDESIGISHSLGLTVSQNLFEAGSLSFSASNQLSHGKNSPFSYSASLSTNLDFPLVLSHPEGWAYLAKAQGSEQYSRLIANQDWDSQSQRELLRLLGNWGTLELYNLRIQNLENRIAVLSSVLEEKELLWRSGRGTLLDIQEIELNQYELFQELLDLTNGKKYLEYFFSIFLLDDEWAGNLSMEIDGLLEWANENSIGVQSYKVADIQQRSRESSLSKSLLNRSPRLSISLSAQPNNNSSADQLWDSVYSYWNEDLSWDYNLSLRMNFSLAPWDSSYLQNDSDRIQIEALQYQKEQSKNDFQLSLINWDNQKRAYEVRIDQAQKQVEVEKDRLAVSQALAQSGRILASEVRIQEASVQRAEIDLIEEKWNFALIAKRRKY